MDLVGKVKLLDIDWSVECEVSRDHIFPGCYNLTFL